jgi:uncharacterized membrane protein
VLQQSLWSGQALEKQWLFSSGARYLIQVDRDVKEYRLLVRRNCSMPPARLMGLFALAGLVSVAVAMGFAAAGAWLILPFAGIEVIALAWAFIAHARHATDCESIVLKRDGVVVEVREGESVQRHEFGGQAVRLHVGLRDGQFRLMMVARQRATEVGRHWDEARRRELALTLRREGRSLTIGL